MRVASLVAVLVLSSMTAHADEQKIPLKDVPKPVMQAVKSRFPKAEVTLAEKVVEKGITSFEVSLKEAAKTIDVMLTAEGQITAIETILAVSDLPKLVAEAASNKYPHQKVKSAEELIEIADGKEIKSYELIVDGGKKDDRELKISPTGKILSDEEVEDEDE